MSSRNILSDSIRASRKEGTMPEIRAKIEPTFTLTIECNGKAAVLYSATKNRLPCGLIHWEGRIDDERGTPREGSIVTFSDEPNTLLPLGEFFPALVGGQQVVAASQPVMDIIGRAAQEARAETGEGES
jgi:hypothetical protein